jgi:hypothetical protein
VNRSHSPRISAPRPPAPGQSLAERILAVAATWDTAANGAITPADVAAGSAFVAAWVCVAGHRWSESVSQRTSDAGWKQGEPSACRVCAGYYEAFTFSCGHTVTKHWLGAPNTERPCRDCYDATKRTYDSDATIKAACRDRARVDLDLVWAMEEFDRLPEWLQPEARKQLQGALTWAHVGVAQFGRDELNLSKLVPLVEELRPIASGEITTTPGAPLQLLRQMFWAPAVSGGASAAASPESHTIEQLEEFAAATLAKTPREWDTTEVTDRLTMKLKQWARSNGWRGWRELRCPLPDDVDARAVGRFDLVIFRPGLPELVVEIDSANVDRSIAKLERARDLGAVPVWIRWSRGCVQHLDGVMVIDLTQVERPSEQELSEDEQVDLLPQWMAQVFELGSSTS